MDVVNKVDGFNVTLMSNSFGWIELTNNGTISGYIYISDDSIREDDRLGNIGGAGGRPPYVVMFQKFSNAELLLSILRTEKDLQIRFAGAGTPPVAFLESSCASGLANDDGDPRMIRTATQLARS